MSKISLMYCSVTLVLLRKGRETWIITVRTTNKLLIITDFNNIIIMIIIIIIKYCLLLFVVLDSGNWCDWGGERW